MSTRPKVSITQLRDPIAGVVEIDGIEYEVRKFTGHQFQTIEAMTAETSAMVAYDLVKEIASTIPDSVRLALDKDMIGAIMTLAGNGIEAVQALFPNAKSPATASTSPG